MGGNALKTVQTRRYERGEFEQLESTLPIMLLSMFEDIDRCSAIPYYRTKTSFGDMDILYTTKSGAALSVHDIKSRIKPTETFKNGSVISFDFKELQIDLIHSPSDEFSYALNYFSWNDCGNLIGKLCHKFGLKHGHRGLTLPIRDGTNMFAEIVVTKNHDETLNFLGFDVDRYRQGFDTLDEMFEWITTSKYFTPEPYAFENMNAVARIRDKKRSTYNAFLQFCDNYTGSVFTGFHADKNDYLPIIFSAFPEAEKQFEQTMVEFAFQQVVRTKMNGHMVRELTGLTDAKLGNFIKFIRTKPEFTKAMLVYLPDEVIQNNILRYSREFND